MTSIGVLVYNTFADALLLVYWGMWFPGPGRSPSMAKKKAAKVNTVQTEKAARPVRLDLSDADHQRLERCARKRGLNKASYSRMVILEKLDEEDGGGK